MCARQSIKVDFKAELASTDRIVKHSALAQWLSKRAAAVRHLTLQCAYPHLTLPDFSQMLLTIHEFQRVIIVVEHQAPGVVQGLAWQCH